MAETLGATSLDQASNAEASEANTDDEDDDADDWHNERKELMKASGKERQSDKTPDVTRFRQKKTNLVSFWDFPLNCSLDKRLLKKDLNDVKGNEKIKYLYALLHKYLEDTKDDLKTDFEGLEELRKKEQGMLLDLKKEAMSGVKVIGMTITGVSINNDLVKLLQPEVVIVEEAAEILEPQLLVALTPNLKQLIMIGDQQQLPPQGWKSMSSSQRVKSCVNK